MSLAPDEDGFRATFGLRPNEVLFHGGGFDLLSLVPFAKRLLGRQEAVREFTVGELFDAIEHAASGGGVGCGITIALHGTRPGASRTAWPVSFGRYAAR